MKMAGIIGQGLHIGGGFQQSLNAAMQMTRICQGSYDFSIYTTIEANVKILKDLGLKAKYCEINILDKVFGLTCGSILLERLRPRLISISSFEKTLKSDGVDLVYFLTPMLEAALLQSLNYIFTVWDVCHRDFPEFPEVRESAEFERRELMYKTTLCKAYSIIVDSEELKQKIVFYYNIDPSRISIVPFQPSLVCVSQTDSGKDVEVLSKHGLNPGYLFYPGLFWSHKGHIRILDALAVFLERNGYVPRTVFCGGDSGNIEVIIDRINKLDLGDAVKILGFVEDVDIPSLYRGASALVMPTYFGPTNLPPLEAMSLGVPIIYPRHLRNQCGDAAIYFDVDHTISLCEAIEQLLLTNEGDRIVEAGRKRYREMAASVVKSETELKSLLSRFERRLDCWHAQ
jgi:glycosyltransferase involved in cell wall biosynthesis